MSLKSRPLDTQFGWPMPAWEAKIVQRCDGVKSLNQLLSETERNAPPASLGEQLFLLYQFGVLNVFPPNPAAVKPAK